MSFHVPEKQRVLIGPMKSDESFGNNGLFHVHGKNLQLTVIASDGLGWEHVSVSTKLRSPYWDEMHMIKRLFWDDEDCVVEYHPPISSYVNNHPYCLHLWREVGVEFHMPPALLVGLKEIRTVKR